MSADDTACIKHEWKFQQLGGAPDVADSYEWVRYCVRCGAEDDCGCGQCSIARLSLEQIKVK